MFVIALAPAVCLSGLVAPILHNPDLLVLGLALALFVIALRQLSEPWFLAVKGDDPFSSPDPESPS